MFTTIESLAGGCTHFLPREKAIQYREKEFALANRIGNEEALQSCGWDIINIHSR